MDDLNKKISDLLGSPDGMARIQSMMGITLDILCKFYGTSLKEFFNEFDQ